MYSTEAYNNVTIYPAFLVIFILNIPHTLDEYLLLCIHLTHDFSVEI